MFMSKLLSLNVWLSVYDFIWSSSSFFLVQFTKNVSDIHTCINYLSLDYEQPLDGIWLNCFQISHKMFGTDITFILERLTVCWRRHIVQFVNLPSTSLWENLPKTSPISIQFLLGLQTIPRKFGLNCFQLSHRKVWNGCLHQNYFPWTFDG